MADMRVRRSIGPILPRGQDERFFVAVDVASKIANMVETSEGTLRANFGHIPYVPGYSALNPGSVPPTGTATAGNGGAFTYGRMHGIFQCRIGRDRRELLLLHTGDELWEFRGWNRGWGKLTDGLPDYASPHYPTLFIATPGGVIIAPQGGRSLFYDGTVLLPLGYDRVPGPPLAQGPRTDLAEGAVASDEMNTTGYAHDQVRSASTATIQRNWSPTDPIGDYETQEYVHFGNNRIGTVEGELGTGGIGGVLLDGEWRYATQWVDIWGNVSPPSPRSNPVTVKREQAVTNPAGGTGVSFEVGKLRKQLLATNINAGPPGTIGRVLLRTKDLRHSGTNELYEIPNNMAGGQTTFATIPDNVCDQYPDNVSDAWLLRPVQNVRLMPQFDVACIAFGCLFVGERGTGMLRWSLPGRWGTFVEQDSLIPDPSGADVTGLASINGALLVCTERSTFLVMPTPEARLVRATALSTTVGCVAPQSMRTLQDGSVIWLGREGFYRYIAGRQPELISQAIGHTMEMVNAARALQACADIDPESGAYVCYLPLGATRANNYGAVWFDDVWRERQDIGVMAMTQTRDHTNMLLVAGFTDANKGTTTQGVWVFNRSSYWFHPLTDDGVGVIETGWFTPQTAKDRTSPRRMRLWFRETGQMATVKVDSFRDWRETPLDEGAILVMHRTDDPPPWWEASVLRTDLEPGTVLGSTDAVWRNRRPFYSYADVNIPSCEVFKIRMQAVDVDGEDTYYDWEFIGLVADVTPINDGTARLLP